MERIKDSLGPFFNHPLVSEPKQAANQLHVKQLGPLQHLIGTWLNPRRLLKGNNSPNGSRHNPYSYNIMPLPTQSKDYPAGYLLKNVKYFEEITFSPIYGDAGNRGGDFTQTANVLFYEQRVFFAEGPAKDSLVHAENGSWLFLTTGPQQKGPYGGPAIPHGVITPQPPTSNVVKQISVPHGNSILAQGGIPPKNYVQKGSPSIPNYSLPVIPKGVDSEPYHTLSVGNPYPSLNKNPILPLQQAIQENPPTSYIQWTVKAANDITNISFEQKKAKVVDYQVTYWLLAFNSEEEFTKLAYVQTIDMQLQIHGKPVVFPHVTCNYLTKKKFNI